MHDADASSIPSGASDSPYLLHMGSVKMENGTFLMRCNQQRVRTNLNKQKLLHPWDLAHLIEQNIYYIRRPKSIQTVSGTRELRRMLVGFWPQYRIWPFVTIYIYIYIYRVSGQIVRRPDEPVWPLKGLTTRSNETLVPHLRHEIAAPDTGKLSDHLSVLTAEPSNRLV